MKDHTPLDVASRPVVTFATGNFVALAKRFGVTPETLALVAMEKFMMKPPPTLELISDYPLVNRQRCDCVLENACESARKRRGAACFM